MGGQRSLSMQGDVVNAPVLILGPVRYHSPDTEAVPIHPRRAEGVSPSQGQACSWCSSHPNE